MEPLCDIVAMTDDAIDTVMKEQHISKEEAHTSFREFFQAIYMRGEEEADILDLAIVCSLIGEDWDEYIDLRALHDICHCPYFKEMMRFAYRRHGPLRLQPRVRDELLAHYFEDCYKRGNEDLETFLWRCLCLGSIPTAAFLRLSEDKQKELDVKDIAFNEFERLVQLPDEDWIAANNLTRYYFDGLTIHLGECAQA